MTDDESQLTPQQKSGIVYAVIFASIFAAAWWILPALGLQILPMDAFVNIEDAEVDANGTEHQLTITYDSRSRYPAEVNIRLYRVKSNESADTEVQSWTTHGFVAEGVHNATFSLTLDDSPGPGTYYYRIEANLHLGYNIERTLTYQMPSFIIDTGGKNGTRATPTPSTPPQSSPTESPPTASPPTPTSTPTPTPPPTATPKGTDEPIGD